MIASCASAATVWAYRARVERDAALHFADLAERLDQANAPARITRFARAAAEDERRHARLCTDLALGLDLGVAQRELARSARRPMLPKAPSGLVGRARLLVEVVATSCITETLSTALLGEMHDRAVDARVRAVVSEVLRDEVRHSQIGWAYLAAEHARDDVRFLSDYVPGMLRAAVHDELFQDGDAPDAGALAGLGALERSRRLALFTETMHEVVFPGLARFGVDPSAGASWLDGKRSRVADLTPA